MKKIKVLILIMLIVLPLDIFATGGALRKSSIKTCPNGVTYGMHSSKKDGKHWHRAVSNGSNYYASGSALSSDPCPNSTTNKGTAGQTSGSTSKKPSTSSKPSTSTPKPSNPEKPKSNDTSIKEITIDGELIDINNLSFETYKKNIKINVVPNCKQALATYKETPLQTGENIIKINIKAENGDTKDYELKINKIVVEGQASLEEFILGNQEAIFENDQSTIRKIPSNSVLNFSYKLSHDNAKLVIYHHGIALNYDDNNKIIENIKDKDIITLFVVDENDNERIYDIFIEDIKEETIDNNLGDEKVNKKKDDLNRSPVRLLGLTMVITPLVGLIALIYIKHKKKNH